MGDEKYGRKYWTFTYIEFIYHYTFFEITKFSKKNLWNLTLFANLEKLSNFERILEGNVQNFQKYFRNLNFEKSVMVDELNIMLLIFTKMVIALTSFWEAVKNYLSRRYLPYLRTYARAYLRTYIDPHVVPKVCCCCCVYVGRWA